MYQSSYRVKADSSSSKPRLDIDQWDIRQFLFLKSQILSHHYQLANINGLLLLRVYDNLVRINTLSNEHSQVIGFEITDK